MKNKPWRNFPYQIRYQQYLKERRLRNRNIKLDAERKRAKPKPIYIPRKLSFWQKIKIFFRKLCLKH